MKKKKVIIIGGGFGGMAAAKKLNSPEFELLLIDKTNHHLFQPLLYQVATAALTPADIALPIREIFALQDNMTVIMGEVTAIDKEAKKVILGNGDLFSYDYLIVAIGARHSYFGHTEWEKHSFGLKTLEDALEIRDQILISFEKAERINNLSETAKYLNFVIIGGGPTGVEMAGAIAEISKKTLFKNFRNIKPEDSKVYLIEAAPFILPTFPEKTSLRAKRDLEHLGVSVLTKTMVSDISENGVQAGDLFIESQNVIWAAGNQVSSLVKSLQSPLDRQGRVIVEPDLSIPGHPELFVIGDAAYLKDKNGTPIPGVAPAALQQGRYVAHIIKKRGTDTHRPPFCYFDKGMIATIGKNHAVAAVGKLEFGGFFAWITWSLIHIFYLIGFRNRIAVMSEWIFFYISGHRGARLIYRSLEKEITKNKLPL